MSNVYVTPELIRQINDDIIEKKPKRQLSGIERKLYNLVVSDGILPDDASLRQFFREAKSKHAYASQI